MKRQEGLLDVGIAKIKRGERLRLAIQDKLKELSTLDGFAGVGVFTPNGESIGLLEGSSHYQIQKIGVIANNVMLNAMKACQEMVIGKEELVHIEAEKAHVIIKDFDVPGKPHFHMVLLLSSDTAIGLAKLRMESVIRKLAEDIK